jgi:flagellar biosynthesis protein
MPRTKEGEQRAMAVALKYAPGTAAPTVVAKGRGLIAEEIISRARESMEFSYTNPRNW